MHESPHSHSHSRPLPLLVSSTQLAPYILSHIFSYCTLRDAAIISRISHEWRKELYAPHTLQLMRVPHRHAKMNHIKHDGSRRSIPLDTYLETVSLSPLSSCVTSLSPDRFSSHNTRADLESITKHLPHLSELTLTLDLNGWNDQEADEGEKKKKWFEKRKAENDTTSTFDAAAASTSSSSSAPNTTTDYVPFPLPSHLRTLSIRLDTHRHWRHPSEPYEVTDAHIAYLLERISESARGLKTLHVRIVNDSGETENCSGKITQLVSIGWPTFYEMIQKMPDLEDVECDLDYYDEESKQDQTETIRELLPNLKRFVREHEDTNDMGY